MKAKVTEQDYRNAMPFWGHSMKRAERAKSDAIALAMFFGWVLGILTMCFLKEVI